jgi:hypothetical protein
MSIASVTRELLVRYLDTWTPTALHAARRATFVQAWSAGFADAATAEAALRVFGEFGDRLRGHRLAMVLVGPEADQVAGPLDSVLVELAAPAGLTVHAVAGDGLELLPAALIGASAAGAPLLVYLDGAGAPPIAAITKGRPAEVLLVAPSGDDHRPELHAAGFSLTTAVELVDGDEVRLVTYGTGSAKNLDAFKTALWAVDEYAGVRYRDPCDPDGHLMDISLSPQHGPLRRELLDHLAATGERTVTELRHYALTDTVYRTADATRALTALLTAGTVSRRPEHGRLTGDVIIGLPGTGSDA